MVRTALVALAFLCTVAVAQNAPAVSQHNKPGDSLHYYVRFDGDPSLVKIGLQFVRQGDSQKVQSGLLTSFELTETKKTSPGVFEVNGVIPEKVATGSYLMNLIQADHGPVYHNYDYPKDFTDKNVIEIVDDVEYKFPPVKSVTPEPPK